MGWAAAALLVAAVPASADDAPPDHVPGQVIVQFERDASAAERADARADSETSTLEGLGAPDMKLLEIEGDGSVAATIRELEADPAVIRAEPNGIDRPMAVPNDPRFNQLWGLENTGQAVDGVLGSADADIDAATAWDVGTGSSDTVVAIMDSGIDVSHPDLAPQLWTNPGETPGNGADDDGNGVADDVHGADFFDNDGDPTDTDSGHGTHVAGTALARGNDGFGVTAVSQRASLMVLRVCGFVPSASDPPGDTGCIVADQIDAINYAAAKGARVLNGSLGGTSGTENLIRRDAIYSHPDVLHVFAAGNGGSDSIGDDNDAIPQYPCAHAQPSPPVVTNQTDNVLCVAATTQTDARASFSNFGASTVDLAAPGFNTLSDSGIRARVIDDFSGALTWANSGTRNWQLSSEAPLTSQGITDSPGLPYENSQTYVLTSPAATTIPAGLDNCELHYFRARDLAADGGDVFKIEVLRNNLTASSRTFNFTTDAAAANSFVDLNNSLSAGGTLRVRLTLTTDAANPAGGIHFDNPVLECVDSPSSNGFEFKNGTSMATPHVAGAAALLISRNPAAPTPEIREQILATVDPVSSMSGFTVSGGRLNVGRAMTTMPADTSITGGPGEGEEISGASPSYTFSSNDPAASFQCAFDGGAFTDCSSGQALGPVTPGPHTFAVRSVDPRGNADRTPVTRNFAVESDPPETRITKSPQRKTDARKAKFRFTADEPGSTFECKVDRKPFAPCTSPRKLKRVKPKKHKFLVRAVDPVGNLDTSAAKKRWRVTK